MNIFQVWTILRGEYFRGWIFFRGEYFSVANFLRSEYFLRVNIFRNKCFFRDEYFSGFDILKNFNQNFSISKFSICSSLLLRSSYVSTWHFSIWVSHSGTLSSLLYILHDKHFILWIYFHVLNVLVRWDLQINQAAM